MSRESNSAEPSAEVTHVGDIPICHGCGLMSHYIADDVPICPDCFNKRNFWQGGGPLRVVVHGGSYHETPLCPAVRNANKWYYWRDESCMYDDLAGRMDKCIRCHSHRLHGFDHYDSTDRTVIGHA